LLAVLLEGARGGPDHEALPDRPGRAGPAHGAPARLELKRRGSPPARHHVVVRRSGRAVLGIRIAHASPPPFECPPSRVRLLPRDRIAVTSAWGRGGALSGAARASARPARG